MIHASPVLLEGLSENGNLGSLNQFVAYKNLFGDGTTTEETSSENSNSSQNNKGSNSSNNSPNEIKSEKRPFKPWINTTPINDNVYGKAIIPTEREPKLEFNFTKFSNISNFTNILNNSKISNNNREHIYKADRRSKILIRDSPHKPLPPIPNMKLGFEDVNEIPIQIMNDPSLKTKYDEMRKYLQNFTTPELRQMCGIQDERIRENCFGRNDVTKQFEASELRALEELPSLNGLVKPRSSKPRNDIPNLGNLENLENKYNKGFYGQNRSDPFTPMMNNVTIPKGPENYPTEDPDVLQLLTRLEDINSQLRIMKDRKSDSNSDKSTSTNPSPVVPHSNGKCQVKRSSPAIDYNNNSYSQFDHTVENLKKIYNEKEEIFKRQNAKISHHQKFLRNLQTELCGLIDKLEVTSRQVYRTQAITPAPNSNLLDRELRSLEDGKFRPISDLSNFHSSIHAPSLFTNTNTKFCMRTLEEIKRPITDLGNFDSSIQSTHATSFHTTSPLKDIPTEALRFIVNRKDHISYDHLENDIVHFSPLLPTCPSNTSITSTLSIKTAKLPLFTPLPNEVVFKNCHFNVTDDSNSHLRAFPSWVTTNSPKNPQRDKPCQSQMPITTNSSNPQRDRPSTQLPIIPTAVTTTSVYGSTNNNNGSCGVGGSSLGNLTYSKVEKFHFNPHSLRSIRRRHSYAEPEQQQHTNHDIPSLFGDRCTFNLPLEASTAATTTSCNPNLNNANVGEIKCLKSPLKAVETVESNMQITTQNYQNYIPATEFSDAVGHSFIIGYHQPRVQDPIKTHSSKVKSTTPPPTLFGTNGWPVETKSAVISPDNKSVNINYTPEYCATNLQVHDSRRDNIISLMLNSFSTADNTSNQIVSPSSSTTHLNYLQSIESTCPGNAKFPELYGNQGSLNKTNTANRNETIYYPNKTTFEPNNQNFEEIVTFPPVPKNILNGDILQQRGDQETPSTSALVFVDSQDDSKIVRPLKSCLKTPYSTINSKNDTQKWPSFHSFKGVVGRKVKFDPLALLLDAALEGEYDLVVESAKKTPNPSASNDEGITALHNAICAGHIDIVMFLVEYGCDINAPDSDGWTPLHCAASCNNFPMLTFLVEHGASVFAETLSDKETPLHKCELNEYDFQHCAAYLYHIERNTGVINDGKVYALYDYKGLEDDELSFVMGQEIWILNKYPNNDKSKTASEGNSRDESNSFEDGNKSIKQDTSSVLNDKSQSSSFEDSSDENEDEENNWWLAKLANSQQGLIPKNYIGIYKRVEPKFDMFQSTSESS